MSIDSRDDLQFREYILKHYRQPFEEARYEDNPEPSNYADMPIIEYGNYKWIDIRAPGLKHVRSGHMPLNECCVLVTTKDRIAFFDMHDLDLCEVTDRLLKLEETCQGIDQPYNIHVFVAVVDDLPGKSGKALDRPLDSLRDYSLQNTPQAVMIIAKLNLWNDPNLQMVISPYMVISTEECQYRQPYVKVVSPKDGEDLLRVYVVATWPYNVKNVLGMTDYSTPFKSGSSN